MSCTCFRHFLLTSGCKMHGQRSSAMQETVEGTLALKLHAQPGQIKIVFNRNHQVDLLSPNCHGIRSFSLN